MPRLRYVRWIFKIFFVCSVANMIVLVVSFYNLFQILNRVLSSCSIYYHFSVVLWYNEFVSCPFWFTPWKGVKWTPKFDLQILSFDWSVSVNKSLPTGRESSWFHSVFGCFIYTIIPRSFHDEEMGWKPDFKLARVPYWSNRCTTEFALDSRLSNSGFHSFLDAMPVSEELRVCVIWQTN